MDTQQVALLDSATLTWTFGGGDSDNEQGYVLLQTGDVLTAGVYNQVSQRYQTSSNAFVPDANMPVMLGANSEIGPGMTLMDGRVIWFGASGTPVKYGDPAFLANSAAATILPTSSIKAWPIIWCPFTGCRELASADGGEWR